MALVFSGYFNGVDAAEPSISPDQYNTNYKLGFYYDTSLDSNGNTVMRVARVALQSNLRWYPVNFYGCTQLFGYAYLSVTVGASSTKKEYGYDFNYDIYDPDGNPCSDTNPVGGPNEAALFAYDGIEYPETKPHAPTETLLAGSEDSTIAVRVFVEIRDGEIGYLYQGNKTISVTVPRNQWVVKLHPNGGVVDGSSAATVTKTKYYNQTLTIPTPTKTNAVFKGWYANAQGTGNPVSASYTQNADLELWAIWYEPYAVTYVATDSNVTNMPSPNPDAKVWNRDYTISGTKPIRSGGYVFKEWNTKSDGTGTSYAPGASYSTNAALTLYAIWYPPYGIAYNGNGGSDTASTVSNVPSMQIKSHGVALTLSSQKPTRPGYLFARWNTNSSGTGTSYNPGGTYPASNNAHQVLYAIWTPTVDSKAVTVNKSVRTGSLTSETEADEGGYAFIDFSYSFVGAASGTVSVSVGRTPEGGTRTPVPAARISGDTAKSKSVGYATLSGNVKVHDDGGGSLSLITRYKYDITVTFAGKSATGASYIEKAFFTISVLGDGVPGQTPGHGIAFGKPATMAELMDVGFDLNVDGDAAIGGEIKARTKGGVNLLKGTSMMGKSSGSWASGTFRSSGADPVYPVTLPDSPISGIKFGVFFHAGATTEGIAQDGFPMYGHIGDCITFGAWFKGTAGDVITLQPYWIGTSGSAESYRKGVTLTSSDWEYHSITSPPIKYDHEYISIGYIYSYHAPANGVYVCGMKMEYGKVATPWTPSPLEVVENDSGLSFPIGGSSHVRKVPYVANDGSMDIGQYLDFHAANSSSDYDVRLYTSGSALCTPNDIIVVSGDPDIMAQNSAIDIKTSNISGGGGCWPAVCLDTNGVWFARMCGQAFSDRRFRFTMTTRQLDTALSELASTSLYLQVNSNQRKEGGTDANFSMPSLHITGGRVNNSGDDEGIVVDHNSNNWAGVCLGNPVGKRSVFYYNRTGTAPVWRFNDGSSSHDIMHPGVSGTICLTNHTHNYAGASSAGGSANAAKTLEFTHTNEINFGPKPTSATWIHFGWRWSDDTMGNLISGYCFDRGDGNNKADIWAAKGFFSALDFRTVLYNNTAGTSGNITLSSSAANFNHMRIYWYDTGMGRNSLDIYDPNGKTFNAIAAEVNRTSGTKFWLDTQFYQINGTSMSYHSNRWGQFWCNGTDSGVSNTDAIRIIRVEGWNE